MQKTHLPRRSLRPVESLETRRLLAISLTGATDLGAFGGTKTFTDSVSAANPYDIRKVTLTAKAPFSGATSALSANCDLMVMSDYNNNSVVDAGEIITNSTLAGTASDSFNYAGLPAGTYFIIVSAVGGATANYTLSMTLPASNATSTGSISLAGATDLGAFSGTQVFNDSVSASNLYDIRKVTLNAKSPFNGKTTNLSANCDLLVMSDYNNNGLVDSTEIITKSTLTGLSSDSFTYSGLPAGTYYVIVSAVGGASANYTLTLNLTQVLSNDNSLGTARNVGALGAAHVTYNDAVGSTDLDDYYKFTLSGTQWIKANLSGLSADANIRLIKDVNGNNVVDAGDVIVSSANTGTTAESIVKQALAGTYFIDVQRNTGDTNYALSLSAPWLNIVFKYDYDANGFFTAHPTAKDRLEDAAETYGVLLDSLSAIAPAGTNTWKAIFSNPGTNGGATVTLNNLSIPASTIFIYVGGRSDLAANQLGEGGAGGWSASGTSTWINLLTTRGQAGAGAATPTDFSTWGGRITFSSSVSWNFNTTAPTASQNDFLSVATHEIGHVFGIGVAASWTNKVSNGKFLGSKSTAVFGGVNPPVTTGHWAEGTMSTVNGIAQEAAMDPTLTLGTRKKFTKLDYAGLADIGWQVPTSIVP